jgi:valyl-tRNA synthetase
LILVSTKDPCCGAIINEKMSHQEEVSITAKVNSGIITTQEEEVVGAVDGNVPTASTSTAVSEMTPSTIELNKSQQQQQAPPPRSNAKRDYLRTNEATVQAAWDAAQVYESNADGKAVDASSSFLVTFPYPYMNGVLHIGHAFSFTKAIFRAQYERHMGKNVLLPFAFHCTGMPIQAVSLWLFLFFSLSMLLMYIY